MDISLEVYRNIVKSVGNRADISSLCRVSKGFQYVAERALYNTLYMRDARITMLLCETLSHQPRLSFLVDALTIYLSGDQEDSESEGEGGGDTESVSLPEGYWDTIARALRSATRLRYLNIHINNTSDTSIAKNAWILDDCTFHLRSFHCDLEWDRSLIAFLNRQVELDALYIIDYNDIIPDPSTTVSSPSPINTLDTHSLPDMTTLECTFTEAAVALVPGRPVTHLKTCISRSNIAEKRIEMSSLFSKIKLSTRRLRSIDLADSTYTEAQSMDLLTHVARSNTTSADLRYLGTLVLPIGGREVRVIPLIRPLFFSMTTRPLFLVMIFPAFLKRLQFYGSLMRLPKLECVEVEVSEWDPQPQVPAAFRALASELRLYCSSITRVVFVHDFDRTVVSVIDGVCVLDPDINTDNLWREV